jgi:hypothetical protein
MMIIMLGIINTSNQFYKVIHFKLILANVHLLIYKFCDVTKINYYKICINTSFLQNIHKKSV